MTTPKKPGKNEGLSKGSASAAALEPETAAIDADLAIIIERWPMLPEAVRAEILAKVEKAAAEE